MLEMLSLRLLVQVQFLYASAILLSIPLQLFPAVRIMENGLFIWSGKVDPRVKWLKNGFRCFMVLLCSAVSWVGAADLDKFVAFVGSFAWLADLCQSLVCSILIYFYCSVPLCYIYPAMLHYRACARTRTQKLADIAMIVFGTVAAVYTTVQTIRVCAIISVILVSFAHAIMFR
jgi:proton-coupled amino acid transporter